jgi:hypothetical protein
MNLIKSFSVKSFFYILIMMMLMALLCTTSGIWIWRLIFLKLPIEVLKSASTQSAELASSLAVVLPIFDKLEFYFIPALLFSFMCAALILWLSMRRLFIRSITDLDVSAGIKNKNLKPSKVVKQTSMRNTLMDQPLPSVADSAVIEKKEDLEFNQRLYLHMISVLQREGRLLDFFSENLNSYEDQQIGAAVRNIHDNCKNSLNKYLKPIPVIDKNEGDEVLVPNNFDVNSIKLTGNVVKKPPFQGVLRHKGWQVARLELPTLTSGRNPRIIAPAEVEIL